MKFTTGLKRNEYQQLFQMSLITGIMFDHLQGLMIEDSFHFAFRLKREIIQLPLKLKHFFFKIWNTICSNSHSLLKLTDAICSLCLNLTMPLLPVRSAEIQDRQFFAVERLWARWGRGLRKQHTTMKLQR